MTSRLLSTVGYNTMAGIWSATTPRNLHHGPENTFSLCLFSNKDGLGRRDGGLFHIDDMDGWNKTDRDRGALALSFLFFFPLVFPLRLAPLRRGQGGVGRGGRTGDGSGLTRSPDPLMTRTPLLLLPLFFVCRLTLFFPFSLSLDWADTQEVGGRKGRDNGALMGLGGSLLLLEGVGGSEWTCPLLLCVGVVSAVAECRVYHCWRSLPLPHALIFFR